MFTIVIVFLIVITAESNTKGNKFISQKEAIKLDRELVYKYRMPIEQLMELAGLSCAQIIANTYKEHKHVLLIIGPGNNGGDGLVCARHLKQFGYVPTIYYPIQPNNSRLLQNLVFQLSEMGVAFFKELPPQTDIDFLFNLIVDAVFGFSFKPPISPEYARPLMYMEKTSLPVVSIDVPSGWEIDSGKRHPGGGWAIYTGKLDTSVDGWDVDKGQPLFGLQPDMLISLTAPKKCSENFNGTYHFLGGRFMPEQLAAKYELDLPKFETGQIFHRIR